jgi:hypothetical protein
MARDWTLVLAKRKEKSKSGTPETLRFAEAKLSSLDIRLDLQDRDSVFSPIPSERDTDVLAEPSGGGELDVEAGPVKDVERVDEVEPVEEMEPVMEARQDPGELPK